MSRPSILNEVIPASISSSRWSERFRSFRDRRWRSFATQLAALVLEAVEPPAGLGALAPVAAASAQGVAQVALPAGADAQGPMNEALQFDASLAANLPNLLERQLPGQDDAREPDILPEFHFLHGGVVHLGAGDERQGRQIQLQKPDILDDQGIDADVIELMRHLLRRRQAHDRGAGCSRSRRPWRSTGGQSP